MSRNVAIFLRPAIYFSRNRQKFYDNSDGDYAYRSKRHQVLVKIIVDKDPHLDMYLSTRRESYELKIITMINQEQPRDSIHVTIRYFILTAKYLYIYIYINKREK